MDKDNFLMNGGVMNGGVNNFSTVNYRPRTMKIQPGGVPCSTPLPSSYLNVNWEVPIDQTIPFYSGLNPIVPLPPPSSVPPATSDVILGRLEGICNSAEICPQTQAIGSHLTTDASCFGSSLSSPPNLSLAMLNSNAGNSGSGLEHFSADTTFAERAAKYSCFGTRGFGGFEFQDHEMSFNGKLSRVSSNKSLQVGSGSDAIVSADFPEAEMRTDSGFVTLNGGSEPKFNRLSRASTPGTDEGERQVGHKGSIVSDQAATGQLLSKNQSENSNKKRKTVQKGKSDTLSAPNCNGVKIVETDESKLKKSRGTEAGSCVGDESKAKFEHNSDASSGDGSKKQSKESQKPVEAPKQDYIHVRARRGQATDSHSLAERVRREKISERMKFLQDLVPGCSKVIGKAVMLDEIINYVQSLQRQVEFLSMKLATVNPRLDFNVDGLLQKDMLQSRASSQMIYPLESSASVFPYGNHSQPDPLQSSITSASETQSCVSPLESTLCRSLGVQLPSTDGFGNVISQFTTCWDDDLQSVVQMAFGQNQEGGLHGSLPTSHMKIEL